MAGILEQLDVFPVGMVIRIPSHHHLSHIWIAERRMSSHPFKGHESFLAGRREDGCKYSYSRAKIGLGS